MDAYYPIAGVVLGLIIGSFLATIVVRWPVGESVLKGRSRCDHCKQTLGALDLFPVISYFLRRGKGAQTIKEEPRR